MVVGGCDKLYPAPNVYAELIRGLSMAQATTQTDAAALPFKLFSTAVVALGERIKTLYTAQPVPYWTDYLQDCREKDCGADRD